MPGPLHIEEGQRFGRLTIIKEIPARNHKRRFLCKCDCGEEKVIALKLLTQGEAKSCGCKKRDHLISMTYKHGYARERLYITWQAIKQRCLNPNNPNFHHYGGRGIKICDEWMDYLEFRRWSLSAGYTDYLTIERIDVHGGYNPGNCTWIPKEKQVCNTRSTRWVDIGGRRMNFKDAAELMGINYDTAYRRVSKGWTNEDAILLPVKSR